MSTEVATLEQQASALTVEVSAMTIADAASYARAGEMAKTVALYIKRVGEVLDPICDAAFAAHKIAVGQRDALLKPAQGAKRILGERMGAWDREQARLRREAEDQARRERERQEAEARAVAEAETRRLQAEAEAKRIDEAGALEAAGDREGAERLISAPVAVAAVKPMPIFAPRPVATAPARVDGITHRDQWSAEVTDLMQLVQAVAVGRAPLTLVKADEVALNQMARALKQGMNVPGVRAVPKAITSVRA